MTSEVELQAVVFEFEAEAEVEIESVDEVSAAAAVANYSVDDQRLGLVQCQDVHMAVAVALDTTAHFAGTFVV